LAATEGDDDDVAAAAAVAVVWHAFYFMLPSVEEPLPKIICLCVLVCILKMQPTQ